MSERHDITLKYVKGWGPWKRHYQRTFRGSSTVWHDVKTGERPGTRIEKRLSEIAWLREQGLESQR